MDMSTGRASPFSKTLATSGSARTLSSLVSITPPRPEKTGAQASAGAVSDPPATSRREVPRVWPAASDRSSPSGESMMIGAAGLAGSPLSVVLGGEGAEGSSTRGLFSAWSVGAWGSSLALLWLPALPGLGARSRRALCCCCLSWAKVGLPLAPSISGLGCLSLPHNCSRSSSGRAALFLRWRLLTLGDLLRLR